MSEHRGWNGESLQATRLACNTAGEASEERARAHRDARSEAPLAANLRRETGWFEYEANKRPSVSCQSRGLSWLRAAHRGRSDGRQRKEPLLGLEVACTLQPEVKVFSSERRKSHPRADSTSCDSMHAQNIYGMQRFGKRNNWFLHSGRVFAHDDGLCCPRAPSKPFNTFPCVVLSFR